MKTNICYQGDCYETLQKMESKSVDLIITSPPYNLGNDHHTGNKRTQAYDDNLPEVAYQINQAEILKECYRVLKDDGSMFYNHKNRIKNGKMISPYMWIFPTPFTIKQELVWFNGSQNFDKIRFYPMTERVYWLTKSPDTKLFNAINHHDFFTKSEWPAVGSKSKHTRAFPVEFVKDILKCFPDKQIILDPYMGSGTAALAAKELGKDYIGIEISPEYCEIIKERVSCEIIKPERFYSTSGIDQEIKQQEEDNIKLNKKLDIENEINILAKCPSCGGKLVNTKRGITFRNH